MSKISLKQLQKAQEILNNIQENKKFLNQTSNHR